MKYFIANIILWGLLVGFVIVSVWLPYVEGISLLDNKYVGKYLISFFEFWDFEPEWLRKWSLIAVVGGVGYFAVDIYWKIFDAVFEKKDKEYNDQPSNRVAAKNEKHPSGRIMNRNLINILIVIAILVGLYYVISPYQNCYRNYIAKLGASGFDNKTASAKVTAMQECSFTKSW